MIDTKQMTVNDIRQTLIKDYGLDTELVDNTKGKSAIVDLLTKTINKDTGESTMEDNILDTDFEVVQANEAEKEEDIPPTLSDPGWHDYVMEQFVKEELLDGNPTVDGLRRVAQKMLGMIKSIETKILQIPDPGNERRATAVVTITFEDGSSFDGAGDVYWGNTDETFRNYPVSVAETRAEGRALKKALGLRKINAAEEIAKNVDKTLGASDESVDDGLITQLQLQFIDLMCQKSRLDINISKLLEHLSLKPPLTYKNALDINVILSEFQNKSKVIPEEIKGYNESCINSLT